MKLLNVYFITRYILYCMLSVVPDICVHVHIFLFYMCVKITGGAFNLPASTYLIVLMQGYKVLIETTLTSAMSLQQIPGIQFRHLRKAGREWLQGTAGPLWKVVLQMPAPRGQGRRGSGPSGLLLSLLALCWLFWFRERLFRASDGPQTDVMN